MYYLIVLIAICSLLWALDKHPYDYYVVLRCFVCPVAICTAIKAKQFQQYWLVWLFGSIALVFNPLLPIHLTRPTWQIINILAAVSFGVGAVSVGFASRKMLDEKVTDESDDKLLSVPSNRLSLPASKLYKPDIKVAAQPTNVQSAKEPLVVAKPFLQILFGFGKITAFGLLLVGSLLLFGVFLVGLLYFRR